MLKYILSAYLRVLLHNLVSQGSFEADVCIFTYQFSSNMLVHTIAVGSTRLWRWMTAILPYWDLSRAVSSWSADAKTYPPIGSFHVIALSRGSSPHPDCNQLLLHLYLSLPRCELVSRGQLTASVSFFFLSGASRNIPCLHRSYLVWMTQVRKGSTGALQLSAQYSSCRLS